MPRSHRPLAGALAAAALLTAATAGTIGSGRADAREPIARPPAVDSTLLAAFRWRNLGPDRGGRSIAVSGVRGRAKEGYFGAVGGGLWKTMDGGDTWAPVTDG